MHYSNLLEKKPEEFKKFMESDDFNEIKKNVNSLTLLISDVKSHAQIKKNMKYDLNDKYAWGRIAIELFRIKEEQFDTYLPGYDEKRSIRLNYILELGHLSNDEFRDVKKIIEWFSDYTKKCGYTYAGLADALTQIEGLPMEGVLRKMQMDELRKLGRIKTMLNLLKDIYTKEKEVFTENIVKWFNLLDKLP